jgi:hypothetical protein
VTADITRRHAVAVAIERQPEIFVDQSFCGIAIIGHDHGQSAQGLGLKARRGSLTGFAMAALIGHLFQPVSRLRVDIG